MDTNLNNFNPQIDLGRKGGYRHLYTSNDPSMLESMAVAGAS